MIGFHGLVPGGLNRLKIKLPSKLVQNPLFDIAEIRIADDQVQFFLRDPENGNLYSEIWIHHSLKDAWQQITFELGD
jgi:hypothetical protein